MREIAIIIGTMCIGGFIAISIDVIRTTAVDHGLYSLNGEYRHSDESLVGIEYAAEYEINAEANVEAAAEAESGDRK